MRNKKQTKKRSVITGREIKAARILLGITQEELAIQVGCSRRMVMLIEKNLDGETREHVIQKLAEKVNFDHLCAAARAPQGGA